MSGKLIKFPDGKEILLDNVKFQRLVYALYKSIQRGRDDIKFKNEELEEIRDRDGTTAEVQELSEQINDLQYELDEDEKLLAELTDKHES